MIRQQPVLDMVLISGLSGSGKSVALQSLEDVGYYCVDNLPAVLLDEFSGRLIDQIDDEGDAPTGAAVSIDSRNRNFFSNLDSSLARLESQGIHYRILFLEAEEHKLIMRYSETRRSHPLADGQTSLLEAIRREKELLEPLRSKAERVLDTTGMTPRELREKVRDFLGGATFPRPLLLIESFGYRFGPPREADFVFDVRCLPNPYWDDTLRKYNGLDAPVVRFFEQYEEVSEMTGQIFTFLNCWLPRFASEDRSYITVAIGCTGGRHRSVHVSEKLHARFLEHSANVQIRHRNLST